jgi:hypothetical protein
MSGEEEQDDNSYDYDYDYDLEAPVYPFDAQDKREWAPLFIKTDSAPTYRDLIDGYFRSSEILVKGVVAGEFSAWSEGITATFLFRHYLELSLKSLILMGRFIKNDGTNAEWHEVEQVKWMHKLDDLWKTVIEDVKPKIEYTWNECDIDFVERCVFEFNKADPKSFAYRYDSEEKQQYEMDFKQLLFVMDHVHEMFHELSTELSLMYMRNTRAPKIDWFEIFGLNEGDSYIE